MPRPKSVVSLALVVALCPITQCPPAVASADEALGSRFTFGVLPDTQFYSRYDTPGAGQIFTSRYGSNPYDAQTEFLAAHQRELNTAFVIHLGDVVDEPEDLESWEVASRAMKKLEDANLDYSVLPGNHDYAVLGEGASAFDTYFPESRAAQNSTFGGRFQAPGVHEDDPSQPVDSEYHVVEAEGQKYLVLALGWRANDATLDWAQGIIDAHPTLPVILTSHEISNIDGAGTVFYSDSYGEYLWDRLIRKNDQIFLTISGHHHGAGYHVTTNDAGHEVVNILQDYQMSFLGGNGLTGLLQFDLTGNKLDMTAFSPWVRGKQHEELTAFDELILERAGDTYSVPLNFAERFASFNEAWEPGDADDPDHAALVKDRLSEGFEPYSVPPEERPTSTSDYPVVEGTVAHWRPGFTTFRGRRLADGDAAPVGSVIPDVAGGQDMTRAPLRLGTSNTSITYSAETHELSSDAGSLKWNKAVSDLAVSYFETAAGAPVNSENFPDGYTIEAFVKLDEDFNGDDNGWANALIRDASGTQAGKEVGLDDGDPAQMLGISNLRELRWYALGANYEGFSNWSHEVPTGKWMHVAVVNDPANRSVTMYVDGAPILRDGFGPVGMAGEGFKWLLGTSAWNGIEQDGWYGNIGEIRMVNHPLAPEQWLTARLGAPDAADEGNNDAGNTGSPDLSSSSVGSSQVGSSQAGSSVAAFGWGVLVGAAGTIAVLVGLLRHIGGAVADAVSPVIQRLSDQVRALLR